MAPGYPLDMDWLADMAAEPEPMSERGPWVTARYHGRCRGCGYRWAPGDLIAYGNLEEAWLCGDCILGWGG